MPQSHGTRRKPTARTRGGRARGAPAPAAPRPPAPRPSRENAPPPGGGAPPKPPGGRRALRFLTHNATIAVVCIAALAGGLVALDLEDLGGGKSAPPPGAGDGMTANDMLAKLTASDMDPIAADVVARAKERAYEQHVRELAALKAKAKVDAKARAKLKAEQERERLAKSNPSAGENKQYGRKMSALKGWDRCWSSLETLWEHESGWNERAENPSSGAYGIPQALPGSKLASAGADWRTSSPTQIAWGLGYIKARYKDPCGAWSWWSAHHWY
ncbi:aggregation-promoting factor C-terminal-like domain-containing protein [Actinomadura macrotermitis]|uniref:Lytic transglycosylase domain-containing protein n=1 Tax=Actinomadura macrotermitis TaxID=2585200 RepID=A0A7K0C1K0_9ACTN|nr:lytic transglycosylase domain-containing protein [Actinomadura macrotermitis]MQY06664.1 hypothetical protein [Actinomadura macrotermitis]